MPHGKDGAIVARDSVCISMHTHIKYLVRYDVHDISGVVYVVIPGKRVLQQEEACQSSSLETFVFFVHA